MQQQDAQSSLTVAHTDKAIGEIIRDSHNLTAEQVEQVLAHQRQTGLRFGEAAVALGLIKRENVIRALSRQFNYEFEADASSFPELIVAGNPFSHQAEAFRELRSQLVETIFKPGQRARALAVVSPEVSDGKTYFAANLAVAFSQLGGRTVLIDADMRSPRMQEIFRTQMSQGLSAVLAGKCEATVEQPVPSLSNLFVLPVGVVPPNPTELAQRPAFSTLLDELAQRFDHIIVDTPAASHGSDARIVAAVCGAALLVGRQDATRLTGMKMLVEGLRRTGVRIAGVTMNGYRP